MDREAIDAAPTAGAQGDSIATQKAASLDERSAGQLCERFIAFLDHDLRHRLRAIFATSDLLERQLVSSAQAQVAEVIKTHARRMATLIDDVLEFTGGRSGRGIGLELTEIQDINAGLMTVIQEIDAETDCAAPPHYHAAGSKHCDAARLQMVASMGNALADGQLHHALQGASPGDSAGSVLRRTDSLDC